MRKWIFLLPLIVAACAEKSVNPEAAPSAVNNPSVSETDKTKLPFFMTMPKAMEPVEMVFDSKYDGRKPVNYRKNDKLKMSGSASYSPAALKDIARPAKKLKAQLYVFDLRQESHGFINDKPVTWQAERDWANAELGHEDVIHRERRLLGDLKVGEKIAGTEIKSIETEESLVRSSGHHYVRLTVTDHVRPTDNEVDRFIEAVRDLPESNWVHFHCRAGKGRTTTFMVMYDMLMNAQTDSFDAIIERNTKLSDDYDVMTIPAETDWKYIYQKERAAFVQEFYNYAKANPKGEAQYWSNWGKRK
ncbi:fused DSP-PTPase phosphatase/NAD kinase-like protein [Bdellovibrio sp. HCB288]|uniref:phosphatase domain-containing protein n=1 Tax=Bdellovibrio sp. HCB288 TaxID=3394355 RepID=UPI0039B372F1